MALVKDLLRLQTDIAVAGGEIILSRLARKRFIGKARRGDGQPVLLLPGYMAGDASLNYMRDFLRDCGFDAHTWGLGQNTGFEEGSGQDHVDSVAERILERVEELRASTGRKVALVGHSLGGLYSRETAVRYPDAIDRVITLGSPTIHPYISDNQNELIVRLGSRNAPEGQRFSITGKHGFLHWDADFPPLPCIAIWSPIDAVVFTQSARIPDYIVQLSEGPAVRENLRLICSHSGMAHSQPALLAVADRLAEPLDDWKPWRREDYFSEREIAFAERVFGNRLFHDFIDSDWRDAAADSSLPQREISDKQPPLIRRLRQDHNDFYRLYRMIEDSIEKGTFDSETDYLLLADVARFMTRYLDESHHPLEESIFSRLLYTHPDAQADLDMLEQEHEQIARDGRALLAQVEKAGDPSARRDPARLLVRWQRFCERLRRHVEMEELTLIPLAEEVISHTVWNTLEKQLMSEAETEGSPLSEEGAGEEFRHLFEYLGYVASRDRQSPTAADNRLSGSYLDFMVSFSEKLDELLDRKRSK